MGMTNLWVSDKGYINLALRSGKFRKLVSTDVRRGEISEYNPFENEYKKELIPFEKRMEKDAKGEWIVPVVGYYAMFELTDGFRHELFISKEDMQKHADKYSKAYRSDKEKGYSNSFWTTDFDAMANKTMLRQLLGKWGLLTPELQKAFTSDMAVIDEDGNPEYIDNQSDDRREVNDPSEQFVKKDEKVIDAEYRDVSELPTPEAFR